jgi:hypothetical protein
VWRVTLLEQFGFQGSSVCLIDNDIKLCRIGCRPRLPVEIRKPARVVAHGPRRGARLMVVQATPVLGVLAANVRSNSASAMAVASPRLPPIKCSPPTSRDTSATPPACWRCGNLRMTKPEPSCTSRSESSAATRQPCSGPNPTTGRPLLEMLRHRPSGSGIRLGPSAAGRRKGTRSCGSGQSLSPSHSLLSAAKTSQQTQSAEKQGRTAFPAPLLPFCHWPESSVADMQQRIYSGHNVVS